VRRPATVDITLTGIPPSLDLGSRCILPSRAVNAGAETDGRGFHSHRKAFEHDRLRDQRLTLARYAVVRFTWRQVANDPGSVAAALRTLLARLARP
jgi:hypothetical protein